MPSPGTYGKQGANDVILNVVMVLRCKQTQARCLCLPLRQRQMQVWWQRRRIADK